MQTENEMKNKKKAKSERINLIFGTHSEIKMQTTKKVVDKKNAALVVVHYHKLRLSAMTFCKFVKVFFPHSLDLTTDEKKKSKYARQPLKRPNQSKNMFVSWFEMKKKHTFYATENMNAKNKV